MQEWEDEKWEEGQFSTISKIVILFCLDGPKDTIISLPLLVCIELSSTNRSARWTTA